MGCGSSAQSPPPAKRAEANQGEPEPSPAKRSSGGSAKAKDAPARADDAAGTTAEQPPAAGSRAAEKPSQKSQLPDAAAMAAKAPPKFVPTLPGALAAGGGGDGGLALRLTNAIRAERLADIQQYLSKPGTDVNALLSCAEVPGTTLAFTNATLLHIAVFLGGFNIAKFILVKNADLNVHCEHISDENSRFHSVTAFHMVVALCSLEMIDLFLRSGASLAEPCREYVTYKAFFYADVSVFHLACFRKDADEAIDRLLTRAREFPGVLDMFAGEIRPHTEKHASDTSVVNLSQKNTQNRFKHVTVLHIGVALNRKHIVRRFLEAGAATDLKCGEVSFRYKLSKRHKDLANANRTTGKEVTHGFHSYENSTIKQLAFQTEREEMVPLLRGWTAGAAASASADSAPAEAAKATPAQPAAAAAAAAPAPKRTSPGPTKT